MNPDILGGLAKAWSTLGQQGTYGVIAAGVLTLAVAVLSGMAFFAQKKSQFNQDKDDNGKTTGGEAQDGGQKDNDVNHKGDDFFGR